MADVSFKDLYGREAGVVVVNGTVTLGASGAIASQACKGFSVVKTASEVGRYTVTLEGPYNQFLNALVTMQGAADAAWTASKGIVSFLRNIDVKNKVLDIQFSTAVATPADTELPDGTIVFITLFLKNSSAW